MSMLEQTSDGDIAVSGNTFALVDKNTEVRQRIRNALRSFFREWFLDLTLGVPWIQIVFEKGTPPAVIDAVIKDTILSVPGVVELKTYVPLDFNVGLRQLNVDFSVRTVHGGDPIVIREGVP